MLRQSASLETCVCIKDEESERDRKELRCWSEVERAWACIGDGEEEGPTVLGHGVR